MSVSFIFPYALLLLLLVPMLWLLTLLVPRRLPRPHFYGSLVTRSLLITLLVGALAGAQLVTSEHAITTVFLIDASDSVSPSLRAQAGSFVQAAAAMHPGDQAGIVVFGENALVERAPNETRLPGQIEAIPVVARTNIEEALQLGLALFPADTQKRLVLLSDGGQNVGDASKAAQLAAARQIPISFVDLSAASDGEALVADLRAPTSARLGQQITITAIVDSTLDQTATLRLFNGERLLTEQYTSLKVGTNKATFTVAVAGRGFQSYRLEVAAERDSRPQNNQAEALVRIDSAPRILIVEGQPGEAADFAHALAVDQIAADTVAPSAMPTDLTGLSNYEAVILANVPVQALPLKAVASLPAYVRDLGRGLVMIGGENSYGLGGYSQTPIEAAMPVYMDVRDRQERPDLALVFVIDKSGSMAACHCSGPNRQTAQISRGGPVKVDIAKDAVAQAAALLRPTDTIGVVAFNGTADWVVPPSAGQNVADITNALAPIKPDGGTNVRAGLQAAEHALEGINARIKHAILLTDGWSGGGDNLDLIAQMRQNGITLSVVAAGSGSADYLAQLASAGGGRYYPAATIEEVPSIFVQETITAAGNYLIEEPFTPAKAAPSSILDHLNAGLPQLYGYNGTTAKESATVVLTGMDDAPILAQWQFGLGRSVAWTSDLKGKWAHDWVKWADFPRFAAQVVGAVLPNQSDGMLDTSFSSDGPQTKIDVQTNGAANGLASNTELQARIVSADGSAQEIGLSQIAPNQYRATITNALQGTYLVQVTGTQDGRSVARQTAGLVIPYSPEYRASQSNPALLASLAALTGGQQLSDPAAAFAPLEQAVTSAQEIDLPLLILTLLLLPIDIAIRRVLRRK